MESPQPNASNSFKFDSIEAALADLRAGKCIVVVDDENRENEGDVICAAQFTTAEIVNFMAVEARGLICLAMTGERLDELDLPLMVTRNTAADQTAFTVSIDAAPHLGVTTGISAEDRARTILATTDSHTKPEDLRRPGHIFPLRAKQGGVLKRAGHTEAGVDLARLAGLYPAGVICEIQNPDGTMARLPELIEYAQTHNLKLISIADLISYRLQNERFVKRETVAALPSQFGNFQVYAYRNLLDNAEHLAIVKGNPEEFRDRPVLVRVHSECLTGDALGSLRCDCRMQLQAALKTIEQRGEGIVLYLRQEGRGIGLINKLKAYSLQDMGLDTVEANERLGFPPDLRNYGVGAQMLNDLGVKQICLLTNNPRKIAGLRGYGIEVVDRVPLLIEANDYNSVYLATKAKKLGHMLLQTYLVTVAMHLQDEPLAAEARSELLEDLRELAQAQHLLVQEETRPVTVALFGQPAMTVHLGFDQPHLAQSEWYEDCSHPYVKAVAYLLDRLATWERVKYIEFLISPGVDPMTNLKGELARRVLKPGELPSKICSRLATQNIYRVDRALNVQNHPDL
ncbi:MAG: bifunctional 3,4-dihydroxy-2-butanone-4-phosphate synthase RibB/GTP cyclohydrolase II RibA [Cyanobacteria bacterium SID2]|nr:bifunctional 3,4-dihydroxy-2-butanone-4-phosphate synthase RibB/GTP cyclohydrolase II RibA [Cyanobacteria bacterium SID2]MBP0005370.1 bifunctional 3,4-dihydroxy-2-butanone-4-phosphate synthase RibB/GTP cyclohydrolase II RibA [Cyanobacteria bacterium SBC]